MFAALCCVATMIVQIPTVAGYTNLGECMCLLAGLVLNVWLGLDVWDYSGVPGNLMGQVCPQFTIAWVALSAVAVWVEDRLHDIFD